MKKTTTFTISGMHCTSCALNIDLDLEELTGISTAETNYAKGVSTITFDSDEISETDILASIKKTGYDASILKGKE